MGCNGSKSDEIYIDQNDRNMFKSIGLSEISIQKYLSVFKKCNPKEHIYINLTVLLLDWAIDCNFNVLNLLELVGIHQYMSMNFREVRNLYSMYPTNIITIMYYSSLCIPHGSSFH